MKRHRTRPAKIGGLGRLPGVTSPNSRTSTALSVLRGASIATAAAAVVQFLLGGYQFTAGSATIAQIHSIGGLVALVASIVAAVAAGLHGRAGGNRGLMFHTLGTAILILIQYALGEMASSPALVIVHMIVGVVIMVSAIAMATLSVRKPFARA